MEYLGIPTTQERLVTLIHPLSFFLSIKSVDPSTDPFSFLVCVVFHSLICLLSLYSSLFYYHYKYIILILTLHPLAQH